MDLNSLFTKMTDEELTNACLENNDLNYLYRLDVFLERRVSTMFGELNIEKDSQNRSKMKMRISFLENLHKLCKKRQDDVKEDSDRFNWKFRITAQRRLDPQTYKDLAERAQFYKE